MDPKTGDVEKKRAYMREWRRKNRDKVLSYASTPKAKESARASKKKWSDANKEKERAIRRAWVEKNRERSREYCRKSYWKHVEERRFKALSWVKETYPERLEYMARRKALKLQATPAWADKKAMQAIYKKAVELSKQTGEKFHVDHIVPLKSKIVCGLHCQFNLQILPASLNIAKGNRVWPDMP